MYKVLWKHKEQYLTHSLDGDMDSQGGGGNESQNFI